MFMLRCSLIIKWRWVEFFHLRQQCNKNNYTIRVYSALFTVRLNILMGCSKPCDQVQPIRKLKFLNGITCALNIFYRIWSWLASVSDCYKYFGFRLILHFFFFLIGGGRQTDAGRFHERPGNFGHCGENLIRFFVDGHSAIILAQIFCSSKQGRPRNVDCQLSGNYCAVCSQLHVVDKNTRTELWRFIFSTGGS